MCVCAGSVAVFQVNIRMCVIVDFRWRTKLVWPQCKVEKGAPLSFGWPVFASSLLCYLTYCLQGYQDLILGLPSCKRGFCDGAKRQESICTRRKFNVCLSEFFNLSSAIKQANLTNESFRP